ncbi:sensor histidine kinase [Pseudoalteromonas prydzensis]|uniref:sensor histidine kinase n=1 Tax=Pseudoalteromonas prydzensis TaxID=182141 RepID=UPI0007E4F735|nr:histidine kinase [Pseudoalteromonas prydzensis]MBE0376970.1 two-component system, LytT family, sensor histidine kinase AlgZ [Pseudoalteromonas prydzensis ACAM 620]
MRNYWLCQLLVFISIVFINYSLGVALLNTSTDHHTHLFLRTISHASVFVLLTHFILYTLGNWLCGKLKITRLNIFLLSVLSILLAIIQTLNVVYFTPFILPDSASSMSIQMYKETTVDLENQQVTGIISSFFNVFVMSLVWSGCYLAVVSRREKKLIMSQLKEQQLESLKNQINPHFLFNALNSIRGMIYQDQDKAADIVTQLSELFRYNLTTDLRTHVNFEQEWAICEHYLAIEKVRFGKRLLVSMQCDDSLKKVVLPSMALLTLIENATKHGIANLESGGEITVNVVRVGETVSITVSNPFDEKQLKTGTQLGLQNIHSRLELMFAQRGKLLIQKQNSQFNATLEVPYAT